MLYAPYRLHMLHMLYMPYRLHMLYRIYRLYMLYMETSQKRIICLFIMWYGSGNSLVVAPYLKYVGLNL